jgi:hypothetical protein
VPEGDARDILEEAGNAVVVRPDDVDGIAEALRSQIEAFRASTPIPVTRPDVVARFEYRHLAGELAAVFDEVLKT